MVLMVIGTAVVLTGLLGWFFFGPKRAGKVAVEDGVQVVTIRVDGGYSPDLIEGFGPGCRCGCCSTGGRAGDAPRGL